MSHYSLPFLGWSSVTGSGQLNANVTRTGFYLGFARLFATMYLTVKPQHSCTSWLSYGEWDPNKLDDNPRERRIRPSLAMLR